MRKALPSLFFLVLAIIGLWYVWDRLPWFQVGSVKEAVEQTAEPPQTFKTGADIGLLAPDFLLTDVNNNEVRLTDYLGKVVIINFWASNCPFCVSQMDKLSELSRQNIEKIVVLAINRADPLEIVREFDNKYHSSPNLIVLVDQGDEIYDRYRGSSMPQTFFIDSNGVVRLVSGQELSLEELKEALGETLAAPEKP